MTPQGLEEVKERDALHAKIIAHMSLEGKRSWVRLARHTQHPAYQLKAPVRLGGQKTHPNKVCRKKLEASSGGNREQTCAEWFDRLTRDDTQPPAWKWQGPNLACESLWLKAPAYEAQDPAGSTGAKYAVPPARPCGMKGCTSPTSLLCATRGSSVPFVEVIHQCVCLLLPEAACQKTSTHTHTTASDSCKASSVRCGKRVETRLQSMMLKICSRPSGRRPVWGDGLPTEL